MPQQEQAEDHLIIDQQSWCLSCWNKVDSDRMYEISYWMIIDDHKSRGLKKDYLTVSWKLKVEPKDPKKVEVQQAASLNGPIVLLGDSESWQKWKEKLEAIKSEDVVTEEPWVKSTLSNIPFILRVLYPDMTEDEFNKLVDTDRVFMDRTTFVCEECYLYITQSSKYCGLNLKPVKEKGLFGTKELMPENAVSMKQKKVSQDESSKWLM